MGHVRELYFGCVRCSLMLVQPASRSRRYSSPTLFRFLLIFDARVQPSGSGATANQEKEEDRGAGQTRDRKARAGRFCTRIGLLGGIAGRFTISVCGPADGFTGRPVPSMRYP
jgi:hypothetical protein